MTLAQRAVDHSPHAIGIAENLIVPEAQNAIPFVLNHLRARQVLRRIMLAAVDLDHQLRAVAGEVGDEVAKRHLLAKMPIAEMLLQHPPKRALGLGHPFP